MIQVLTLDLGSSDSPSTPRRSDTEGQSRTYLLLRTYGTTKRVRGKMCVCGDKTDGVSHLECLPPAPCLKTRLPIG